MFVPVVDLNNKQCQKCRKDLPLSSFWKNNWYPDGKAKECIDCTKQKRSSPENLERRRAWKKRNHRTDPRTSMIEMAKHRARRDGVPFEITKFDIEIPPVCPILGVELKVNDGTRGDDSPTLDRVIPKLGYVPGNIAVISHRANQIKNNATADELMSVIEYIKGFQ